MIDTTRCRRVADGQVKRGEFFKIIEADDTMYRMYKCRAVQGSSNAAGGGDAGSGRSAGSARAADVQKENYD